MGFTVEKKSYQSFGDGAKAVADLTFDNSYPTDGLAVTAKELGFKAGVELRSLVLQRDDDYEFAYFPDASLKDRGKVKAYTTGDGLEVANATDLSAVTVRAEAVGR